MRAALRLLRARGGNVALISALVFPILLGMGAFAIDFGSIYLQARKLQGSADLAALAAATDMAEAQAAAAANADANGGRWPVSTSTVIGTYVADSALTADQRFTVGGTTPNAVQVTLRTKADSFFSGAVFGAKSVQISRTATAARAQLASFSIGSGLLSLQGGIANAILGGLTGSQVSLSVADYNALATADVDLLKYSSALQTDMHLQGASFNNVLSGSVSQGEALTVLANLLTADGKTQAGSAMQKLATAAGTGTQAQLSKLVSLGPYGGQDHVSAGQGAAIGVNALSMATALLEIAQGGRQVKLDLGATIPGLTSTTLWLAIGQRPSNSPWLTVTEDQSVVVRTAQIRLYVDTDLSAGAVGGFGILQVDAPLYVELASAQAKLSALTCPSGATAESAALSVSPSVGEIALGQVDTTQLNNFTSKLTPTAANLVHTPILTVTGFAKVDLGGASWQTVSFSADDIQSGTVKTVSTNDIAQASVASLLSNLDVNVQLLGLGLGLGTGAVAPALKSSLSGVAGSLDTVLNTVTSLVGVQLGKADVRINGVRCHDAALVA